MKSRYVVAIALLVTSVLAGFVLLIAWSYGEKPDDFREGTVIETSANSEGRFGFLLFVEKGDGKGKLSPISVGAEGEGIRSCDKVRLYCNYQDPTRCEAREVLKKFLGTPEECRAYLFETGILQSEMRE